MQPKKDRRTRRATHTQRALEYLLEAVTEKFRLLGIVLSDQDGLLVAGSSPLVDAEEMAAVAPLVAREKKDRPLFGWPLQAWEVRTPYGNLALCAIGERGAATAASLHAARRIRAILEE